MKPVLRSFGRARPLSGSASYPLARAVSALRPADSVKTSITVVRRQPPAACAQPPLTVSTLDDLRADARARADAINRELHCAIALTGSFLAVAILFRPTP
jgi:hypothetical protein